MSGMLVLRNKRGRAFGLRSLGRMCQAPVAEFPTKLSNERHRSVAERNSSRSGGTDSGLVAHTNVRVVRRDDADDGGVEDVGRDDNTLSDNSAVEVLGVV